MYRCAECRATFDEPDSKEICYEAEYGVASMFSDMHWGTIAICPDCGSEEIEDYWEDEEDIDEFDE